MMDEELLRRAKDGDVAAFTELHNKYAGLVFNVCLRMLGDRDLAEDSAQESFISAWRNLRQLRKLEFRPWVLQIARNVCRAHFRKRARRPSESLEALLEAGVPEPASPSDIDHQLLAQETRQRIEEAFLSLPEDQRFTVILRDVQKMSYEEVAVALGCSIGTVKSRLNRGRTRLQRILAKETELFARD